MSTRPSISLLSLLMSVFICCLTHLGCSKNEGSSGSLLTSEPEQQNACALIGETEPLLDPPAEFYRSTGKPVFETVTFNVPEDGELCVVVTNGEHDPPQGNRVSAAWIYIDDELVIDPEPFSQIADQIMQPHPITAGDNHELSVKLASKPGSHIKVELGFLPAKRECPCLEKVADPGIHERIIDDRELTLEHLRCFARVVTLHANSTANGNYRSAVLHTSGDACDWETLIREDRRVGYEFQRTNVRNAAEQLPDDWRGDVIVWLKDEHPVVEYNISKTAVLSLLDDQRVGRIILPDDLLLDLVRLGTCTSCISQCYVRSCDEQIPGDSCTFGMYPFVSEASCGRYMRVGIHEGRVFNGLVFNVGTTYDNRVNDPVEALQLGSIGVIDDYHSNRVASIIWGLVWSMGSFSMGHARESDPVSVGMGEDSANPTELFIRYMEALPFLWDKGVAIVNYSSYYPLPWDECDSIPTRDFELLQDYYAYTNGMLPVQAVGNMCESSRNQCLRLTNAITVGGSNPIQSQTQNIGYYGGGLEIPHVVANCYGTGPDCQDPGYPGHWIVTPEVSGSHWCAGGNSFNAPIVTSLASYIRWLAILSLNGNHYDAVWPEVQRAIIMASADYSPFVGSDSSPYCSGCPGTEVCPAVDCYYGAGQVDGDRAYLIYNNGDFLYDSGNIPAWSIYYKQFRCDDPDCYMQAAFAWSNAISCDDTDCSGDGRVTHDFDMILEQRKNGAWTPIMKAQSRGGTTEWLRESLWKHIDVEENNRFRLRIWQVSRSVNRGVSVGLAFFGDKTSWVPFP